MEPYKPVKLESVDDLWYHRGDLMEVEAYSSLWKKIRGKKLKGKMEVPEAWEQKDFYEAQKDLIWSLTDEKGQKYNFRTIKQGYTLDDVLDDVEPEFKELHKKQYQKELVPLSDIKILECYHHEFF